MHTCNIPPSLLSVSKRDTQSIILLVYVKLKMQSHMTGNIRYSYPKNYHIYNSVLHCTHCKPQHVARALLTLIASFPGLLMIFNVCKKNWEGLVDFCDVMDVHWNEQLLCNCPHDSNLTCGLSCWQLLNNSNAANHVYYITKINQAFPILNMGRPEFLNNGLH